LIENGRKVVENGRKLVKNRAWEKKSNIVKNWLDSDCK
jgi:hypothetical protein